MREEEFSAALNGAKAAHFRFSIYRNNISQGLVGALRVRFPVVEQLVGSDFFSVMASAYSEKNKPSSAMLIKYGSSVADFISNYEPARELDYLQDVARFENAWWQAYHAAEAMPVEIAALSKVAPEDWCNLVFTFHPSFQLFQTQVGAVSIWQWHQNENNTEALAMGGEEFAMVFRPHEEVRIHLIGEDAFAFLQNLASGVNLETALNETHKNFPDFDLQTILAAMFQLEFITGLSK